jgi:hypothetical protein
MAQGMDTFRNGNVLNVAPRIMGLSRKKTAPFSSPTDAHFGGLLGGNLHIRYPTQ